jgi:hypothetical protein
MFNSMGNFGSAHHAARTDYGSGITETLYDSGSGAAFVRGTDGRVHAVAAGAGYKTSGAAAILDAIRQASGGMVMSPGSVYDVRTQHMLSQDAIDGAAAHYGQQHGAAGDVLIEGDPGAGQSVEVGGVYQDSDGTMQAGKRFLSSTGGVVTAVVVAAAVLGGAYLLSRGGRRRGRAA